MEQLNNEFATQQELDSLSKSDLEQLEALSKSCPRCGKASANKSNPQGRCRACLNKLASMKKKPGNYIHNHKVADDALRRQKGKNGTASKKSKGLGTRKDIISKVKAGEKKAGTVLSPDRKDNSKGYSPSNTRMVPKELNRGRHHVDGKKLKAWRSKLKKCDIADDEFYTMVLAKAYQLGDTALLSLLEDMHYNDLANFINNEDDGADLPLKKTELLAKDAENSAAYNMKLSAPTKLAHQRYIIKDAKTLPYKAYKTMPNEQGSPELHVMVHRGVTDLNPKAKGKNKLKVNDTHVQTSTDSVHSLYPSAAHEFSHSGNPAVHPSFPKEGKRLHDDVYNHDPTKQDPRAVPRHLLFREDKANEWEAWMQKPEYKKYIKEQDKKDAQYQKILSDWEKARHAAGKDGVLSFWVPISKFNGHGGYKTDDPQAEDQAHVNVAPGKFRRVTEKEMKDIHSRAKPGDSYNDLITPDSRYLYPKE